MWKEVSELKDKKILIVGLGKTGVSLAKFLTKHEAQVTITDHKSKPELSNTLEQLDGFTNIKFELGSHSPKTFLSQDLVILSPGVAPHLKIFEYARQQGIKITGEYEFSSQFIKEPIVGVTGTNGKTLVARIAETMLKESGVEVWVGVALLADAAFYVGNDTAALNMAAAVGVRCYGLFGATTPLRHSPLIIPIMPPAGLDRTHGMAGITPDAAFQAIAEDEATLSLD